MKKKGLLASKMEAAAAAAAAAAELKNKKKGAYCEEYDSNDSITDDEDIANDLQFINNLNKIDLSDDIYELIVEM